MTYASIQELIGATLEPGERRLSFAAAHKALGGQDFEEVAVVLTGSRLLIATVAFPADYALAESLERSACSVLGHEDHEDGTSRLTIGHPDGVFVLDFPSNWRREAYAIREALVPRSGTAAILATESEESLRGALGDVWKNRLLEAPLASPEAEGARILYEAVHGSPRPATLGDEVFAELRDLSIGKPEEPE